MSRMVSERAREREALKYATIFCNITERTDASDRPITLSSADSSLSAFAQLGALRLGAARCLISVFDEAKQYIIAEGTSSSSLVPSIDRPEDYWLGCTTLPRSQSFCRDILTDDGGELSNESDPSTYISVPTTLPVSIVSNLAEDALHKEKPYVVNWPYHHFYAGVPLRTPRGINIGALSVFDDKPRDNLDSTQIEFLQQVSWAIMSHLELRRAAENSSRSERMVRGIGSFVEGKSTVSNLWRGTHEAAFEKADTEGKLNTNQQTLQQADMDRDDALYKSAQESSHHIFTGDTAALDRSQQAAVGSSSEREGDSSSPPPPLPAPPSEMPIEASTQQTSQQVTDESTPMTKFTLTSTGSAGTTATKSFANELHSAELKEAFGKAANIIRESIEVEGVAFLDAMIDTFGGLVPRGTDSESASSESQPDSSCSEGSDVKVSNEPKFCKIFGFSTTDASSIDNKNARTQINVPQKFLRTLLRRYPTGKTFRFDDDGELVSGDSEEDQTRVLESGATEAHASMQMRKRNVAQSRQSESTVLSSILQGARSVMMVPLWDPIRERWHASAFVWTKSADRVFTMEKEVSYLRAFGSTIMTEISRIEATQSEKMKSDLLGSLSHELRSPLHGVLAGIELIQDTELDAFQGDALHSMESCGRTLLDVIEHLLDFSKMNRFVKSTKEQKKATKHGGGRLKDQQQAFESKMAPLTMDIDLSVLVEEVVESVYAGFGYERLRVGQSDRNGLTPGSLYNQDPYAYQDGQNAARFSTGGVTIYIDIDAKETWIRHIQPGGLRRIIMNILGNSMKYTNQGYIYIKMRQVQVPIKRNRHRTNLVLTITDSGKGITPEFLRYKLFSPFSQEDSLQPGTGLGLSLIHQIITLLNGSITVESQLGVGTSFQVTLPLLAAKSEARHSTNLGPNADSLKGLRVGLRGFKESEDTAGLPNYQAPIEQRILTDMCETWLQLEIVPTNHEDTRPDCIICTDEALNHVMSGVPGLPPPIVVVCQNGSIAQSLYQKHRTGTEGHFLECISQPIGPHKLYKALVLVMDRWKKFTTTSGSSPETFFNLEPDINIPAQERKSESSSVVTPSSSALPLRPNPDDKPTNKELDESGVTQSTEIETPAAPSSVPPPVFDEDNETPTSFLIVDDNKINLQILSAFMKKMKRSFKSANDGLEALKTYAATPGHFRCVLMDISMPVMDGLEATRRIREFEQARQLPRSIIIALTGMASASTQQEAFGSGVDFFLPKPVRLKQLTEILEENGIESP